MAPPFQTLGRARGLRLLFSVTISVGLVLSTAATASAAAPQLPPLNPPAPDFLRCAATGSGAICTGKTIETSDVSPSGLLCGTTTDHIELLFENSETDIGVIRFYNQAGDLTSRLRREMGTGTVLNPVTGLTAVSTQVGEFTSILATPGDFDTATETQRGVVKFYLPGAGVLFIDVGRAVIPPDGNGTDTRQHPFDQYFNGGTSVLEALCEALGSPGTPSLP
jgi:hypothetical protein